MHGLVLDTVGLFNLNDVTAAQMPNLESGSHLTDGTRTGYSNFSAGIRKGPGTVATQKSASNQAPLDQGENHLVKVLIQNGG